MKACGMKKDSVYLILIVLIGAALRLDYLFHSNFGIEADEAIVGLMAKHISEGGRWPIFYYGQPYMGSLEALLVAVFFKLFGVSRYALKAVPFLVSLAVIPALFALGRRIYNLRAAKIAALLFAVPPSALVLWSVKARGGFIEVILLGAVGLLLTVRWLAEKTPTIGLAFAIGLIFGVGWWINAQIVYFAAPSCIIGGIAAAKRAGVKRFFLLSAAAFSGFLVGSSPFWAYNLTHNFSSIKMLIGGGVYDIGSHIKGFFKVAFPILLGARRFWHEEELFYGATLVFYGIYLTLFLVALYPKRDDKPSLESGHILLVLFLVFSFCVFVGSSFGYLVKAPRYLLPMYVGIFLLCGYGISRVWEFSGLMGGGLLATVLFLNLVSQYGGGRAIAGEPVIYEKDRVSRDHTELISWLDAHGYRYVKTNYWIGYRLAFETGERIKFSVFLEPENVRIPEYELAAPKGKDIPYILAPSQAKRIERALFALGYKYASKRVSGYVVLYNTRPIVSKLKVIQPGAYHAFASHGTLSPDMALDGNYNTRWGSGAHQEEGMWYKVVFEAPLKVASLLIDAGKWWHDYPRGLKIIALDAKGDKRVIYPSEYHGDVMYFLHRGPIRIYFEPFFAREIRLIQTSSHPVFDWSIAELKVYGPIF
ncbi:MAG: hypothetical protein D6808_07390 [Candidatus Dadabacteria bacterium]|nr:MAG: hypothetical protein D6808_07390 [Candidatus Dadabacteria bacterium]